MIHTAGASAPTNIAVVKYWGKRDKVLNLPINSSLSVTLHQDDLRTITSVAASKEFTKDRVWLNGIEEDVESNKRLVAVFDAIRSKAGDKVDSNGQVIVPKEELKTYKIHVVSKNSFPTAAGLASSASGYACLVKALAQLFNVVETRSGELSEIARKGSGSASRSLYGGYVKWEMGKLEDGTDSIASQVAPESAWNNMHALICVVSDHKKTTSSTGGMIDSVRTSDLLAYRAKELVPARMKAMEEAIFKKDFKSFAELTMKDSNQFHATCLDTFPPIAYMTDVSHSVSRLVHEINGPETICAYTFDAGPNAVIFVEEQHVQTVLERLLDRFGPSNGDHPAEKEEEAFVRGQTTMNAAQVLDRFPKAEQPTRGHLKYIIHTKVGPGAYNIDSSNDMFLMNTSTGLPK